MVTPASASIMSSTSMKLHPRRAATSGPRVVLPEPMKPVRTMPARVTELVEACTNFSLALTCLQGERLGHPTPTPIPGRKILVSLSSRGVRCKIVQKQKELPAKSSDKELRDCFGLF